jgi:uncharacterized protein
MHIKLFKKTSILLFLFIALQGKSQQNNELINSGKVIEDALKLHEKEQYKAAITLLATVNRSDTNYSTALYEMSLSQYADSNFDGSIKSCELGIALFPEKKNQFYNILANAQDDKGNWQKAIAIYDTMIVNNKHDYLAYFNKGVTYYQKKKYTQSSEALQQCALVNPYYSSAHYFLGNSFLEQGKPVQAMLCYCTYLIVSPKGKYLSKIVAKLNSIADAKDDIILKVESNKNSVSDNFEQAQEILLSKVALDTKYKLKTSLEDKIVRQLQVVLEKIEFNNADKSFAMQYYVPLFKQAFAKNFEEFTYYIFSGLDIKEIKNYVKRNEKDIVKVIVPYLEHLNTARETQILNVDDRAKIKLRYTFNNGTLSGCGESVTSNKNETYIGPWTFYFSNGIKKSEGSFDETGKRIGIWKFYYNNGQLKEKAVFVNDLATGETSYFYDNGIQASQGNYLKGNYNGSFERWYFNGMKRRNETYNNDKKDGPVVTYNNSGFLSGTENYSNDIEDGMFTSYYVNGQILASVKYLKGVRDGEYKKYYYDGSLQTQGNYINGKKDGVWKDFFMNGKTKTEINYVNDLYVGEEKNFYENGTLQKTSNYIKDKLEGKSLEYDDDGKLYCESGFEKGRLREIIFYDKKGNIISNTTSKKGDANLIFYNTDGIKSSEGYFTKDGLRSGLATFYYPNQKTMSQENYKLGNLDGSKKWYHRNGALAQETSFKNGDEDGYNKTFWENGNIKQEGWLVQGKKQGQFIEYDEMGVIKSKTYYLNDDIDGYSETFDGKGRKEWEYRYETGWITSLTQYDTMGKIISFTPVVKGKANYALKHFNGKDRIVGSYLGNHIHGPNKIWFFDGTTSHIRFYNQGYQDSLETSYYYGGKLHTKGLYKLGDKVGAWKTYYENGKVIIDANYKNGNLHGTYKLYNEDGTIEKEIQYNNGKVDGYLKIFAENGELAYQLNYLSDELKSYTYFGKDGILVPNIAITSAKTTLKSYFKNGNQSAEVDFEDFLINGKRNIFFSTGKPYIINTREWGKDVGEKTVYFANGNLEKVEQYNMDNLHGLCKYYYENGKIKSETNYWNGEVHGQEKKYLEQGKIQTRTYYFDILIDAK